MEIDPTELQLQSVLHKHVIDTQLQIIFHIQCAEYIEDKVVNTPLIDIREMLDKVIITEKTEAPVDKREEKKDAWDNLSF